MWINASDIILIGLRDYQDNKADVILKYTPDEARNLKAYGELPESGKELTMVLIMKLKTSPLPEFSLCINIFMTVLQIWHLMDCSDINCHALDTCGLDSVEGNHLEHINLPGMSYIDIWFDNKWKFMKTNNS